MMRRMRETHSEDMRQYYQKFLSNRPCSACGGRRVRTEALGVKLGGRNIAEITGLSVADSYEFFTRLELKGADAKIAVELLKEIRSRLKVLLDVGLRYLTLERPAPSPASAASTSTSRGSRCPPPTARSCSTAPGTSGCASR